MFKILGIIVVGIVAVLKTRDYIQGYNEGTRLTVTLARDNPEVFRNMVKGHEDKLHPNVDKFLTLAEERKRKIK